MRYISLFSGIEAASVAWHPLGWTPLAFSEIEAFPSAVLAHHYPDVPNFGDVTKFKEWPDLGTVDLLVGGSPCQSFSVAGLRAGMADPRGNLVLSYLAVIDRYRPKWVVYENVPGLLSSGNGRDFGSLLGGLAELGYGFAYRVLDAQFCRAHGFERAVPQRRRRVFVVGYLGDWRRAAAVLFDGTSLRGDPAPGRQSRKDVAPTISSRPTGGGGLGTDFDLDGGLVTSTGDIAHCLNAGGMGRQDYETETMIAHALRGEGFDASEDGTGRGTPIVAVADTLVSNGDAHSGYRDEKGPVTYPINTQIALRHQALGESTGMGIGAEDDPAFTLQAGHSHAVAFDMRGREGGAQFEGPHDTANIRAASGGSSRSYVAAWAVRRLTPTECERLQGFPDGYTAIPFRKKPAADGPRYKALGNSMAVNVMRVLGSRIQQVEAAA